MSFYTHFTEEEKNQARNTDIVSFLRHWGETWKRSGSEYEWESGSGKVTIRGNLTFPEVVSCLLPEHGIVITVQQRVTGQKEKTVFVGRNEQGDSSPI